MPDARADARAIVDVAGAEPARAPLPTGAAALRDWFERAHPADAAAARAQIREALDEVLPSLIEEVAHHLARLLDRMALATLEARADGSGQAPAALREEVHALSSGLVDLMRAATERGIDVAGLIPARLRVDLGTPAVSYDVLRS